MMLTVEGMKEMLGRLKRLPADWDGEGSPPITNEAIDSCNVVIQEFVNAEQAILNRPIKIGDSVPEVSYPSFLYPYKGGGLSLWWEGDTRAGLIITPSGIIIQEGQN